MTEYYLKRNEAIIAWEKAADTFNANQKDIRAEQRTVLSIAGASVTLGEAILLYTSLPATPNPVIGGFIAFAGVFTSLLLFKHYRVESALLSAAQDFAHTNAMELKENTRAKKMNVPDNNTIIEITKKSLETEMKTYKQILSSQTSKKFDYKVLKIGVATTLSAAMFGWYLNYNSVEVVVAPVNANREENIESQESANLLPLVIDVPLNFLIGPR